MKYCTEGSEEGRRECFVHGGKVGGWGGHRLIALVFFLFPLRVRGGIFGDLRFGIYRGSVDTFIPGLLEIFEGARKHFERGSFTFSSRHRDSFSKFSFFVLPWQPFRSSSAPLRATMTRMEFSVPGERVRK